MATEIFIDGTEIAYRDFSITVPTSPMDIAPSAEVTTNANESISANDSLEIVIDGTTRFSGRTRSGGTISDLGGVDVTAYHQARDEFERTKSFTYFNAPAEAILSDALAFGGSNLTLDYPGTSPSIDGEYDVNDRPLKRVFRDMMDRTNRVWWVDPAGTTVHVEPLGGRGTWQAINTQNDKATLQKFDSGNIDTVRNEVTVVGTNQEQVRGSASDFGSQNTYGRRTGNSPYNVSYVTTQTEAEAVAESLLIPEPQPEGTLLVGSNVGDITQPLANYQVDVTDPGKDVTATDLVVESQTIEQGRATLTLGTGAGVSIEEVNRSTKSQEDQNEPGSVYGEDRISDDAISSDKLAELSITETKITDGAISTPKLQANSITANEIDVLNLESGDISISDPSLDSAMEYGAISFLGASFHAFYPTGTAASSLGTPNDEWTGVFTATVYPPSDNSGSLGTSATAWADVYAHNYVTASPDAIEAVDRDEIREADWYENPPAAVRERAKAIGDTDDEIPEGRDHTPVELGTIANWLLSVCKDQQEQLDDLRERVERLEDVN